MFSYFTKGLFPCILAEVPQILRKKEVSELVPNENMKKKSLGLLPKLLIAIILGIAMGFAAQYMGSAGECIIRLGATYNSIFGNFINFCIPLIILGFVVPGIAELGSGAGKTLAVTVLVAYLSTIVAGSLAYAVDMGLFPHLVEAGMFTTSAENAEETVVSSFFNIEMPPIMGVMSALIMAFILGLGIALCRAGSLKGVFDDFGSIMTRVVERIIIPLLPIHVYGIFAKLAYAGTIVELMTSFLKVFVVVIALHIVILLLQYTAAGAVSHRNPFALLRTMLPAYTTAIGTQSSAATIPVTVDCAKRNGVQESIAQFVCPLCATIHLSGSTITLTSCSIAVMMMTVQACVRPLRDYNSVTIVGVLRGGGDVRMATLIDLTPLWAVALPLAVLSGLVFQLGILWVYLSMMSENVVKTVLGTKRFLSGRWINDVTLSVQPEAGT